MGGVDASRIIARVTNTHIVGWFSVMNLVRKTMSGHETSLNFHVPIAGTNFGASPVPTFVWPTLVHLAPKSIYGSKFSLHLDVMAGKESNRLPSNAPLACVCYLCDGGRLSTPAHAKPGRIGATEIFSCAMTVYKTIWLSLCDTVSGVVTFRDQDRLPTPTLAFTIWRGQSVLCNPRGIVGYVFGKVWGMIHVSIAPPTLSAMPGTFTRRLALFIGVLQVYCSTKQTGQQGGDSLEGDNST